MNNFGKDMIDVVAPSVVALLAATSLAMLGAERAIGSLVDNDPTFSIRDWPSVPTQAVFFIALWIFGAVVFFFARVVMRRHFSGVPSTPLRPSWAKPLGVRVFKMWVVFGYAVTFLYVSLVLVALGSRNTETVFVGYAGTLFVAAAVLFGVVGVGHGAHWLAKRLS